MKSTCISSACLPPSLPAVRPISGGRIRLIFLIIQNVDLLTHLLFWLRFIHCALVSPFILLCLLFSLTDERKGEKSLKGVDKLYGFYLLCHANGQMHLCLIASSVKIKISYNVHCCLIPIQVTRMVSCWD